jgi:hypothetical protein
MDTPQTCGRGLAEHSPLPAKMSELTDAVGVILELHIKALDLADPATKEELDAYRELANAHRDAAVQLHTIATKMTGYRDLPMGTHDPTVLNSSPSTNAFEAFVRSEEQLLELLQKRLQGDRRMLAEMHAMADAQPRGRTP